MTGASPDLSDPAWFLSDLDLANATARFVHADRDALSQQPFLDPRWSRDGLPQAELPGAALDAEESDRARLNFIWHTSYCCSTALAAALDRPGKCLALKEPQALVGLANLKRGQQGVLKRPGLARAVFGLLGRRFDPAEQILIKPSNFANALLPEAAAMTDGRSLMLYSSCRSFLISILKRREGLRAYARELFVALTADGHAQGRWPLNTLMRLTDLQIAAVAWHMQVAAIRQAMAAMGDRAVSLDGDTFLDDPAAVIQRLDRFFGLDLGEDTTERAARLVLERDVKTGAAEPSGERRRAAALAIEETHGDVLDRVVDWAAEASGLDPSGAVLPRPLL